MLYTKACPRCSGDVKLDRDNYGIYAKCLQCGFNRDFIARRETFPGMADTSLTAEGLPPEFRDGALREDAA